MRKYTPTWPVDIYPSILASTPLIPFAPQTHMAGFSILYAAYILMTAAKNVHVPNVRLLSAVTCFGVVGGGSIDVGLYTRDVNARVLYA